MAVQPQFGRDPVIDVAGPLRDFAVTISDGRRVIGRDRHGEWTVFVYDTGGRLLAHATGRTRLHALQFAGLSGDDTGEVLGRSGI